jgi:Uma2 family endonuclease
MEQAIPKYTLEEYFRLAEESPTKLEFRSGEILDMAGATYAHNQIAANLIGELRNLVKGRPCRATGRDTRVRTADDRYCYPDVTVVCGEPSFDRSGPPQMTITNPQLIFEVLSPSTEVTDRGEKFIKYINLDSMQGYFLVAQDRPQVESFFRRDDDSWSVGKIAAGLDASLVIHSLNLSIPLSEVYANIRFDTEPTGLITP